MGDCTSEGTKAQIIEALQLVRFAKCMLLVGGELATLAVATARLGNEEMKYCSAAGNDAKEISRVAFFVGNIFRHCRLVRMSMPEIAERADGLLQAFCCAVDGDDSDVYVKARDDIRDAVYTASCRISELAASIRAVCAVIEPENEIRGQVLAGMDTAAISLGGIALRMEQVVGSEEAVAQNHAI